MHTRVTKLGLATLACMAILAVQGEALAKRYVRFEVMLDEKVVRVGQAGDDGEDADVVWNYLRELPLKPGDETVPKDKRPAEGFEIEPDADDPLKATLKGKVRVFCRYGGDVELDALRLVRDKADEDAWRLAPDEVDRTLKLRKAAPNSKVRRRPGE